MRRSAAVAAAIGEPTRLRLLQTLMQPATVSELVRRTGQRQSNVSNHLAVLRSTGLVVAKRRGRLVEYALAGPTVAQLVESLSVVAGAPQHRARTELAEARTCYDHLAGRLGVALFDRLITARALQDDRRSDGALGLGPAAARIFAGLGVRLDAMPSSRRRLAYRCLDWTERRPHLGGALGAAVAARFQSAGLVKRRRESRGLDVSPRAWALLGELSLAGTRAPRRGRS